MSDLPRPPPRPVQRTATTDLFTAVATGVQGFILAGGTGGPGESPAVGESPGESPVEPPSQKTVSTNTRELLFDRSQVARIVQVYTHVSLAKKNADKKLTTRSVFLSWRFSTGRVEQKILQLEFDVSELRMQKGELLVKHAKELQYQRELAQKTEADVVKDVVAKVEQRLEAEKARRLAAEEEKEELKRKFEFEKLEWEMQRQMSRLKLEGELTGTVGEKEAAEKQVLVGKRESEFERKRCAQEKEVEFEKIRLKHESELDRERNRTEKAEGDFVKRTEAITATWEVEKKMSLSICGLIKHVI